jgi:hypothetical protein
MAWNEVNEVDASKGIYTVCGKLWLVGPRYKLQGHIGSGTYGDVCKAIDLEFNQIIALKRVPDIFYCHMLAKRVLREVCIMRRLCHPYIISCKSNGPPRWCGNKLQSKCTNTGHYANPMDWIE